MELASLAGSRRLGLGEFLTGPRKTALRAGEILAAIHVPEVRGQGGFLKLGARRYLVISIAMVAARIVAEGGIVTEAALAVGACSPVAVRLAAQEAALLGAPLAALGDHIRPDLVEPYLSPIPDIRADAAYRAGSATELLRRVVSACGTNAGEP
ncbi:nicotinate dehydrogenase FAD-subunit [mine drainage metagenome]|uniref:Nicotinate dehydrogenase FAD-subunit n=1 Tax=mine drainage metagenome TaxID=410659 RepID=A0A1J5PND7_9ZZZZ